MTKEVKRITLGFILSWLFGVLFGLIGLAVLFSGPIVAGVSLILVSLVLLPSMNRFVKEKLNFELSRGLKITFVIILFLIFVMSLPSSNKETTQQENTPEIGKIIKAPDTGNILFILKGTEIVDGYCSSVKSFDEYGVVLPKDCEGVSSFDVTNYCELGTKKGENVNYYYCRPQRVMRCKIVSSSGEVKDVKYYGITKVLQCDNTTEQLIDIRVRSCIPNSLGLGFDCS